MPHGFTSPAAATTAEKTSKDKMLNDIEIVIINKNLND